MVETPADVEPDTADSDTTDLDAAYPEVVDVEIVDVEIVDVDAAESSVPAGAHVADEVDALVAEGASYDHAPDEGTVAAAEDEDALTRLVREAMQSAVETARSSE